MGDAPANMLGKARAVFGDRRFWETVALLDELRRRWPDFEYAEGHLLYARALQESGRMAEAVEEYRAVSAYYSGANPASDMAWRCRSLAAKTKRAQFCLTSWRASNLRRIMSVKRKPSGLPWRGRRLKSDPLNLLSGSDAP